MTRHLIEDETGTAGPVNIYTLTVISDGLRTGDWASSTSLDYFLDSYSIDKFHFIYAEDMQALLKRQPPEPHFWIAFFEIPGWPQRSPARQLEQAGYRVGDAIIFQQGPNRVALLPVWRK
jgi:hypothetical protein